MEVVDIGTPQVPGSPAPRTEGSDALEPWNGPQLHIPSAHNKNEGITGVVAWEVEGSRAQHLATVGMGRDLHLWEVSKGHVERWTIKAHGGAITSIDCSFDGRWLVSGGWDFEVKVWDIETRTKVWPTESPDIFEADPDVLNNRANTSNGCVRKVVFAPKWPPLEEQNGEQGKGGGTTGGSVRVLPLRERAVAQVSTDHFLVWIGDDQVLRCVRLTRLPPPSTSIEEKRVSFHRPKARHIPVTAFAFHPLLARLVVGLGSGMIEEYRLEYDGPDAMGWHPHASTQYLPHTQAVTCLESAIPTEQGNESATSNQLFFLSGSLDRSIKIWDWETLNCVREIPSAHFTYPTGIGHLGTQFVSVSARADVKVWSMASGECQHVIHNAHESFISAIYPTSAHSVATVGNDATLNIWSVRCGMDRLDFHNTSPASLRDFAVHPFVENAVLFAFADHLETQLLPPADSDTSLVHTDTSTDAAQSQGAKPSHTLHRRIPRIWWRSPKNAYHPLDGAPHTPASSGSMSEIPIEPSTEPPRPSDRQLPEVIKYPSEDSMKKIEVHAVAVSADEIVISRSYTTADGARNELLIMGITDNVTEPKEVAKVRLSGIGRPSAMAIFSLDGLRYLLVGADRSVKVLSLASLHQNEIVYVWQSTEGKDGHTERIRGVSITNNSQFIVTCSTDKTVKLWRFDAGDMDKETGTRRVSLGSADGRTVAPLISIPFLRAPTAVACSPSHLSFAVSSKDRDVRIYRINENGRSVQQIGFIGDAQERLKDTHHLEFAPCGMFLYTVDQFGGMRRWPLNLAPLCCTSLESEYSDYERPILKTLKRRILDSQLSEPENAIKDVFSHVKIRHGVLFYDTNHIISGEHQIKRRANLRRSSQSRLSLTLSPRVQWCDSVPTILALRVGEIDPKHSASQCLAVNKSSHPTHSEHCHRVTHVGVGPGAYQWSEVRPISDGTAAQRTAAMPFFDTLDLKGRDLVLFLVGWLPTLLTSHGLGKRSYLHHAICTRDVALVELLTKILLATHDTYILPSDKVGVDPLMLSIKIKEDDCAEKLLDYLPKAQGIQPMGSHVSIEHILQMIKTRPAVVAQFLNDLKLAPVSALVTDGVVEVDLAQTASMRPEIVVCGHASLSPSKHWSTWKQAYQNEREGDKNLKEYTVQTGVIGIAGFSSSTQLLPEVVDSFYHEDLLNTEIITHLINYKWKTFGRELYINESILFLFYVIAFCTFVFVSHPAAEWHLARLFASAASGAVAVVLVLRLLYREWIQLDSGTNYFSDPWNYIDIVNISLGLLTPAMIWSTVALDLNPTLAMSVSSVSFTVLFCKSLFFGRAWEDYGALIRMIFEIIRGMGPFLAVLIVTMLGFCFSFHALLQDAESDDNPFTFFSSSLVAVYTMMLGEFDMENFEHSRVSVFLFVFYMFIVFLIMLNVVIAIISDTYDRVIQKQDVTFKRELAGIFVETEQARSLKSRGQSATTLATAPPSSKGRIAMWKFAAKQRARVLWNVFLCNPSLLDEVKRNPPWLHVLMPNAKAGDQDIKEWHGRVAAIKQTIDFRITHMERRLAAQTKEGERKREQHETEVEQRYEAKLEAMLREAEKKQERVLTAALEKQEMMLRLLLEDRSGSGGEVAFV